MVGAGFSRNAISIEADELGIPLWRDITKELFNRLYPQYADDVSQNVGKDAVAANDALRLAQEYETGFGRSDLSEIMNLAPAICTCAFCVFLGAMHIRRTGTRYWSDHDA